MKTSLFLPGRSQRRQLKIIPPRVKGAGPSLRFSQSGTPHIDTPASPRGGNPRTPARPGPPLPARPAQMPVSPQSSGSSISIPTRNKNVLAKEITGGHQSVGKRREQRGGKDADPHQKEADSINGEAVHGDGKHGAVRVRKQRQAGRNHHPGEGVGPHRAENREPEANAENFFSVDPHPGLHTYS